MKRKVIDENDDGRDRGSMFNKEVFAEKWSGCLHAPFFESHRTGHTR
jgi:hypothetical protein